MVKLLFFFSKITSSSLHDNLFFCVLSAFFKKHLQGQACVPVKMKRELMEDGTLSCLFVCIQFE